jgi:hypothetical protein
LESVAWVRGSPISETAIGLEAREIITEKNPFSRKTHDNCKRKPHFDCLWQSGVDSGRVIVGANNAQGVSVCQGNFNGPLCAAGPRHRTQGTRQKNKRKLIFSLRLIFKSRFSANFFSIFPLKVKKSEFLYLIFFI